MQNSDILNRAASIIEVDGWAKGPKGLLCNGPKCIDGAIGAAAGLKTYQLSMGYDQYFLGEVEDHPAAVAVKDHLGYEPQHRLWAWNDNLGRFGKKDCLAALRDTAQSEALAGR